MSKNDVKNGANSNENVKPRESEPWPTSPDHDPWIQDMEWHKDMRRKVKKPPTAKQESTGTQTRVSVVGSRVKLLDTTPMTSPKTMSRSGTQSSSVATFADDIISMDSMLHSKKFRMKQEPTHSHIRPLGSALFSGKFTDLPDKTKHEKSLYHDPMRHKYSSHHAKERKELKAISEKLEPGDGRYFQPDITISLESRVSQFNIFRPMKSTPLEVANWEELQERILKVFYYDYYTDYFSSLYLMEHNGFENRGEQYSSEFIMADIRLEQFDEPTLIKASEDYTTPSLGSLDANYSISRWRRCWNKIKDAFLCLY